MKFDNFKLGLKACAALGSIAAITLVCGACALWRIGAARGVLETAGHSAGPSAAYAAQAAGYAAGAWWWVLGSIIGSAVAAAGLMIVVGGRLGDFIIPAVQAAQCP